MSILLDNRGKCTIMNKVQKDHVKVVLYYSKNQRLAAYVGMQDFGRIISLSYSRRVLIPLGIYSSYCIMLMLSSSFQPKLEFC